MNFTYRPLPEVWPSGKRTLPGQRQRATFKAPYSATMTLLDRELRMLGVSTGATLVIEAGYKESEIRLDGQPRVNARPDDPAIVISFESRYGPLRYGCDTFTDWIANLRAIALALEALRKVDRYGVTKRGEQYQGWKALPPASGEMVGTSRHMSRDEAIGVISSLLGGATIQNSELDNAYRLAARRAHPDAGGTRQEWDTLQEAKQALRL